MPEPMNPSAMTLSFRLKDCGGLSLKRPGDPFGLAGDPRGGVFGLWQSLTPQSQQARLLDEDSLKTLGNRVICNKTFELSRNVAAIQHW